MAYDSQRGVTVLFGGYSFGFHNDTWEWDGSSWTQVATTGPWARRDHAMAYDSLRGVTVLFGGQDSNFNRLGDTWEWDGTTWTQVANTTAGPSPRRGHAMAYDSQRGRIVLFGGDDANGSSSQTWEWHAGAWQPLPFASGPPARRFHAMAYDSARGVTVLFGGFGNSGDLGDTWEWNGTTWASMSPASAPPARRSHAMVYNSLRGKAVSFGGYNGVTLGGTWEWDGNSWTGIAITAPSTRDGHAMAYDSLRGKAVLFGGYNNNSGHLDDTWEFNSQNLLAFALPYGTGCGSPLLDLTPQANARPVIGAVARAALTNIPSQPGISFVALGWSRTTSGGFALPLSLAGFGMPGCDLLTSAETPAVPTTPTGPGTANLNIPLPNNTSLVGLDVYLQGWAVAPGTNPGNTVVSNGVHWGIGGI